MAKAKTRYVCGSCGQIEPRWMGRCTSCGSWNSFTESLEGTGSAKKAASAARSARATQPLSAIDPGGGQRLPSGLAELDRVLGGGIMSGSSILVGGAPGIGKSTLMLQLAGAIALEGSVLYVAGEESAAQIKQRSTRLKIGGERINVLSDTALEAVEQTLEKESPSLVIVDSVQTLVASEAGSVPGTVNQIKYCAHEITSWCREHAVPVFLVAHITKEGSIAGPRLLEHMVDTVLYFDQSPGDLRVLRSTKNRFGSVDELGLFYMGPAGLEEIRNPESVFIVERSGELPPGITAAPVFEGTRVLMVEIQALTVPAKASLSRVYADGIDSSRVARVAAVLEKHLSLSFSDQDLYINVAGGIRINEVGIELPLAVALYSARTGLPVPREVAVAGELSLAGEIRPIQHLAQRIRNAAEMGYTRFIGPRAGSRDEHVREQYSMAGYLSQAIRSIFHGE